MLDVRVTRDSVEHVKRPRYITVAVAHAPYVAVVVVIKVYRSLGRGVTSDSTNENRIGNKKLLPMRKLNFLVLFSIVKGA